MTAILNKQKTFIVSPKRIKDELIVRKMLRVPSLIPRATYYVCPRIITRDYHGRRLVKDMGNRLEGPAGQKIQQHEETHVCVCADNNDLDEETIEKTPKDSVYAVGILTSKKTGPADKSYEVHNFGSPNFMGQEKTQSFAIFGTPRIYPLAATNYHDEASIYTQEKQADIQKALEDTNGAKKQPLKFLFKDDTIL